MRAHPTRRRDRVARISHSIRLVIERLESRILLSGTSATTHEPASLPSSSAHASVSTSNAASVAKPQASKSPPGQVLPATLTSLSGIRISKTVRPDTLTPVSWTGEGNGTSWTDPNNWSTNAVPDADSDVTINAGATTITISGGAQSIDSLTASRPISLSGGSLSVATTGILNATLAISGGSLIGGTWSGSSPIIAQYGTLNEVTVNENIQVPSPSSLTVLNGLVLNGTLTDSGSMQFTGTQTLSGNGTIILGASGSSGSLIVDAPTSPSSTLTIGSGIVVEGQSGSIGLAYGSQPGNLINQGTIQSNVASGTLSVGGLSALTNTGTLKATNGGTLNVGAASWNSTGVVESDAGSTFNIQGTYTNTNATLALTGAGMFGMVNGTVQGGTLTVPAATTFGPFNSGTLSGVTVDGNFQIGNGTLSGVTVNGNFQVTTLYGGTANITNGLVLNGTATVSAGITSGVNSLQFSGTQTLSGDGIFVLGAGSVTIYAQSGNSAALTIGSGTLIRSEGGSIGNSGTCNLVNQGTIESDGSGDTMYFSVNVTDSGTIEATNGGNLNFRGLLTVNGQGSLSSGLSSAVTFEAGLLGNTTNSAQFSLAGAVYFYSSGSQSAPMQIEVMSQDDGATAGGFINNYATNSLLLQGGYIQLVDSSHNSADTSAEAIYTNSLAVPAGTTLNLNGLHLYARSALIQGTVANGSVTVMPAGGSQLPLDQYVSGVIATPGQADRWTFYGQAGHSIEVGLVAGDGAAGAQVLPILQYLQLHLIGPTGTMLEALNSTISYGSLSFTINLPASGNYVVIAQAASQNPSSTGSYALIAIDTTPVAKGTIVPNQQENGTIGSPYGVDDWTYTAAAGTQVQFALAAASSSGLEYSLTGPNGFVGFTNATGSSGQITLPSSGSYSLTVEDSGGSTGSYSFELFQTSQTVLVPGTPYLGTFAGTGQIQIFEVPISVAGPATFTLTDDDTSDHNELYVKYGSAPTLESYGYAADAAGASQNIVVPDAEAGNWYVLVYSEYVASAPASFTLGISTGLTVSGSNVMTAIVAAPTTLTLTGAGFSPGMTVSLVAANGTSYTASSTSTNLPTQLTADFAADAVPAGSYTVHVARSDGAVAALPLGDKFIFVASGQPQLTTNLELPDPMTIHIAQTLYIDYANTGTAAMQAPLLILSATNQQGQQGALLTLDKALQGPGLFAYATPPGFSHSIEILGSGASPGLLQPGESERIPVYYSGWLLNEWQGGQLNFTLQAIQPNDTTPVNWSSLQASLQPPGISSTAWSTIFSNLQAQMGTTAGGYVQLLDNEESYLNQLGENVTSVSSLWGLAVQQADNALNPLAPFLASATDDSVPTPGSLSLSFDREFAESISGRDLSGPLGMGWSTPWQESATIGSDGSVTLNVPGGGQRVFDPSSIISGAYYSQPGDTGTLAADGSGGYLLTEASGIETDFTSAGLLNYMQDTNGNRITAGYTAGELTSLTASSGQSIDLAYNSAGLISSITDSTGRTTTYSYDPTDTYLTSVASYNGQTTSYTYNTASGSAAVGALTSIAFPGGTHQYFTYDSLGRVSSTYGDGDASPESFTYSLGQVDVTDGTGDISALYYNEDGLVVKSVDALGNPTYFTYDGNFNLSTVTNAAGQSEFYSYNAAGEVTSSTDFLGNKTYFTYGGSFNNLTSLTDSNGNITSYSYNTSGDLLSTTYANGTMSSSTFNPEGEATSFLNQNGQPINFTYNAAGQVLTEAFSDGSQYTYTYDSHGNLLTATDATGTTTFTYDPTTEFMTEVAYPNGTYLKFGYNAAGQRTQMVDQTGFTTNYQYDSAGRLSGLTDGNGNVIVTYSYDAAGRLSNKVNGNGTYTTYKYDADGNVLQLTNYAPGGAVNSEFTYSYNALGLETTEATIDGTWTYGYDADGQLTTAVFASTNPSVPSQNLVYNYDAMGNRTSTVINGVTTNYTVNDMNEYASVGGVPYTYDADGNLLSDGTNTYSYNSLNQLVGVVGTGGMTAYTYNALGQQITSTASGVATQNLIDPAGFGSVVGQFTGSGGLIADYVYGLGLTSQVVAAGSYYYDFDALGSTAGLSNRTGAYVNSYMYLPFGGRLSSAQSVNNLYGFVGQLGVSGLSGGLDNMRARVYLSAIGQFLTEDPMGIGGGDMNMRRYVANDPTNELDAGGTIGIGFKEITFIVNVLIGFGEANFPNNYLPTAPSSSQTQVYPYDANKDELIRELNNSGSGITEEDSLGDLGNALPLEGAEGTGGLTAGGLGGVFAGAFIGGVVLGGALEYLGIDFGVNLGLGDWVFGLGAKAPSVNSPIATTTTAQTATVNVVDPNALYGPSGYGPTNFVLGTDNSYPYQIDFENSPTATAPVQEVTITDQLNSNLNWSTFQLTGIDWGSFALTIPAGSQSYETTVPMTYDGETFDVEVNAGIHTSTGQVYATFLSIDPSTGLPPSNALVGFLPPEDGTGRGQGFITYTIAPNANLVTGTQITNVAYVSFDGQTPIATDEVDDEDPTQGIDPTKQALVTIDSGAPTSSVTALAPMSGPDFTVSWSGEDDAGGSGIADYTIYASVNGGAFAPWLTDTTGTSAVYTGVIGNTYSFYSVATDNVGNVQATPASAQATTEAVALPAWLSPTSLATWNASTQVLTVSGASTIIADPGTDEPIIEASGSAAVVTIDPTSGTDIHLGGLSLTDGASATVTSLGAARSLTNYRLLVIGSPGATAAPMYTIDPTSTLDLADNDMAILYGSGTSPLSTVESELSEAYDNRAWDKPGLTSSIAKTSGGVTALGYGEASTLGLSTFDGLILGGNAVLVKYTLTGDAYLTGSVGLSDYNTVLSNFNGSGDLWTDGSFDYSGNVGLADYNAVISNFNQTLANVLPGGSSPALGSTTIKPTSTTPATGTPTHKKSSNSSIRSAKGD